MHGDWLSRWALVVARWRWLVVGCWVALLTGCALLYPHYSENQAAVSYLVSGSDSARVEDLLADEFPRLGAEQDVVLFHSDQGRIDRPGPREAVQRTVAELPSRAGVRQVVPPFASGSREQVSASDTSAIALVSFDGDVGRHAQQLQRFLDAHVTGDGPRAYVVGETPVMDALIDAEYDSAELAEAIGIPIAFAVLLLATGALVVAVLPVLIASIGVVVAFGVLGAVSYAVPLDGILTSVVPMIGLGVGIDYTLFVVARYREELVMRAPLGERRRDDVYAAIAVAMSRSGRTILYSGLVVLVSLLSLTALRASTFRQLGLGMSLAVGCALLTASTLLPALLAILGHAVERGGLPWRQRVIVPPDAAGRGLLGRFARMLMRRPVPVTIASVAVLMLLASPMLGMRLGVDLGMSGLGDAPVAKGQRLLAREFSPGVLMPLSVVYTVSGKHLQPADVTAVRKLSADLARDERVSDVTAVTSTGALQRSPLVSKDGHRTYLSVVPSVAPDDTSASDLVREIRDDMVPAATAHVPNATVQVGGQSAQMVDIEQETRERMWLVIALVLGASFVFLLVILRSVVLPLKAIAMNVFAYGAAFGALLWVFQSGHLEWLFGFESRGTVQVYLPLVMFAMLFGLSMDYEVFLVRRIQEEWQRTGDNEHAVAVGLEHTALQITAAAAIMVAVFGAFITGGVMEMKQIGFGFAFAVLVDATGVRLLLVPAVMRLAGRYNWWLPRWLDRLLPRVGGG